MTTKYFIVTAGPTGAGKTKLIEKTLIHLGINDQPYVKILIDDLVESDQNYKEKISDVIKDIKDKCDKSADASNCEKAAYNNPTKELFDKFGAAYYAARRTAGCHGDSTKTCDQLNDEQIPIATTKNENIVFETTGASIPDWLLDPKFIPSHYKIVMAYSLVTLSKLIERIKSRLYNAVTFFNADHRHPAPRLPDVSPETFKNKVEIIFKTLLKLYDSCVLSYDDKTCGKTKISQLLVFDNNGDDLQLKFDSVGQSLSKTDFKELILPSFGITDNDISFGGGRRGTKRGTKRGGRRGGRHSRR